MHSIKNTVIAVGLLGLSFLFYQASSTSNDKTEEMVPALEISDSLDGMQQLATNSTDTIKSKASSLPSIEMPKIEMPNLQLPNVNKSTQAATDFAADMGRKLKQQTSPLKKNHRNLELPEIKLPIGSRGKNNSPAPTNQQFGSNHLAGSNDFGAQSQPSVGATATARDAGLIAALGTQNQFAPQAFAKDSPPVTQPFSTGPANSNDFARGANDFGSQPIPNSDTSFNKLATDESSNNVGSNVVHAGTDQKTGHLNFQSAWPQVQTLSDEGNYREALRLLSRYYRSDALTGPQRQRLIGWLDALAGKVIFSDEHHLQDTPYTVSNETLVDIGKRWRVPGQLIYNINRKKINNPAIVPPGTQLKMIEGPFSAEIDTKQKVMTLFLDDLYAGRFPIRVGISGSPNPGSFRVLLKSPEGHNWRDADGNNYPPGTSENGYGPNWIGLSGSLCIHAVADSVADGHRGCIGLSTKDAKDVFAILTKGSSVKILR